MSLGKAIHEEHLANPFIEDLDAKHQKVFRIADECYNFWIWLEQTHDK